MDYGDARKYGKMASFDPTEAKTSATSASDGLASDSTESLTTTPFYQEPNAGHQNIVGLGLGIGVGVAVAIVLCVLLSVGLIILGARLHSYVMRRHFNGQPRRPVQPIRPLFQKPEEDIERWPAALGKESAV